MTTKVDCEYNIDDALKMVKLKDAEGLKIIEMILNYQRKNQGFDQLFKSIIKDLSVIALEYLNQKSDIFAKIIIEFTEKICIYNLFGQFPNEKIRVYNNLACLQRKDGLYNQAVDNLKKALQLLKSEKLEENMGLTYLNLCSIYTQQKKFQKSIKFASLAIKQCEKDYQIIKQQYINSQDQQELVRLYAIALYNRGFLEENQLNHAGAKIDYEQSLRIINDNLGQENELYVKINKSLMNVQSKIERVGKKAQSRYLMLDEEISFSQNEEIKKQYKSEKNIRSQKQLDPFSCRSQIMTQRYQGQKFQFTIQTERNQKDKSFDFNHKKNKSGQEFFSLNSPYSSRSDAKTKDKDKKSLFKIDEDYGLILILKQEMQIKVIMNNLKEIDMGKMRLIYNKQQKALIFIFDKQFQHKFQIQKLDLKTEEKIVRLGKDLMQNLQQFFVLKERQQLQLEDSVFTMFKDSVLKFEWISNTETNIVYKIEIDECLHLKKESQIDDKIIQQLDKQKQIIENNQKIILEQQQKYIEQQRQIDLQKQASQEREDKIIQQQQFIQQQLQDQRLNEQKLYIQIENQSKIIEKFQNSQLQENQSVQSLEYSQTTLYQSQQIQSQSQVQQKSQQSQEQQKSQIQQSQQSQSQVQEQQPKAQFQELKQQLQSQTQSKSQLQPLSQIQSQPQLQQSSLSQDILQYKQEIKKIEQQENIQQDQNKQNLDQQHSLQLNQQDEKVQYKKISFKEDEKIQQISQVETAQTLNSQKFNLNQSLIQSVQIDQNIQSQVIQQNQQKITQDQITKSDQLEKKIEIINIQQSDLSLNNQRIICKKCIFKIKQWIQRKKYFASIIQEKYPSQRYFIVQVFHKRIILHSQIMIIRVYNDLLNQQFFLNVTSLNSQKFIQNYQYDILESITKDQFRDLYNCSYIQLILKIPKNGNHFTIKPLKEFIFKMEKMMSNFQKFKKIQVKPEIKFLLQYHLNKVTFISYNETNQTQYKIKFHNNILQIQHDNQLKCKQLQFQTIFEAYIEIQKQLKNIIQQNTMISITEQITPSQFLLAIKLIYPFEFKILNDQLMYSLQVHIHIKKLETINFLYVRLSKNGNKSKLLKSHKYLPQMLYIYKKLIGSDYINQIQKYIDFQNMEFNDCYNVDVLTYTINAFYQIKLIVKYNVLYECIFIYQNDHLIMQKDYKQFKLSNLYKQAKQLIKDITLFQLDNYNIYFHQTMDKYFQLIYENEFILQGQRIQITAISNKKIALITIESKQQLLVQTQISYIVNHDNCFKLKFINEESLEYDTDLGGFILKQIFKNFLNYNQYLEKIDQLEYQYKDNIVILNVSNLEIKQENQSKIFRTLQIDLNIDIISYNQHYKIIVQDEKFSNNHILRRQTSDTKYLIENKAQRRETEKLQEKSLLDKFLYQKQQVKRNAEQQQ